MDLPPVETEFHLKPIDKKRSTVKLVDKFIKVRDKEISNYNFSPGQQDIYNYVLENPNNIVVVQGFPDSGKTYTLRAIAHRWHSAQEPVNVIIYKRDLLPKFEDFGNCRSKTKFFMDMFHISSLETYKGFEDELYGSFNNAEFLLTIVNLIARADIKTLHGSLVIFDEYNVPHMPKPLLLVTLMLLKHYKIGAILCGDKCLLQNEKSDIMGSCTSYDIAKHFADKSFWLRINETDSEYNKVVNYIGGLGGSNADDCARSLIAAVFPKQLFRSSKFTDTHLAGSREELKVLADYLVSQEGHPCRPYEISTLDGKRMQCSSTRMFLNYLPLVVGSSYYVDHRSEGMKGKLVRVKENKVVLRLNGVEITRKPSNNDAVILSHHKNELLGGKEGAIYNFPIYPANFKTLSMSTGPVSGPLHIMFKSMTCRGIYDALSRVKDVSQLKKVSIDNPISHLSSCIINFEELIDSKFVISAELLKKKMAQYKYYDLKNCNSTKLSIIECLVHDFFREERPEARMEKRDALNDVIKLWSTSKVLVCPTVGDWTSSPIHEILKYTDYWLGLACMKEEDRGIWLSEFLARTPALKSLTGSGIEKENKKEERFLQFSKLFNLPKWHDTLNFIKNKRKTPFIEKMFKKYNGGREHEITTKWLVDILNDTIRKHSPLGKEGKENQDKGVCLNSHEDNDEQEPDGAEGRDEDTDSAVSQNSVKGQSIGEKISSTMKRTMEEDDDTVVNKKKMSNPSTVDKHDSE